MTRILLFCTDEAAKPVAREVLNFKYGLPPNICTQYYLVESHVLPETRSGFKTEINESETFESDFIGASLQDCQNWALEKQFQVNYIEQEIIALVDARSAQDKTILVSCHLFPTLCEDSLMFPGFGILPRPQDKNTWIDYRIAYRDSPNLSAAWIYGDPDGVYPAYIGCKEQFTDERGIFNVEKAEEFSVTYNPDDYRVTTPRL